MEEGCQRAMRSSGNGWEPGQTFRIAPEQKTEAAIRRVRKPERARRSSRRGRQQGFSASSSISKSHSSRQTSHTVSAANVTGKSRAASHARHAERNSGFLR